MVYCFAYLLYALFERIVNEPFEEQPEQQYEEENVEALEQEGKWLSPSAYSIWTPCNSYH